MDMNLFKDLYKATKENERAIKDALAVCQEAIKKLENLSIEVRNIDSEFPLCSRCEAECRAAYEAACKEII